MESLPPKPPGPPPPPEPPAEDAAEGIARHPGALPPEQPAPDGAAPAPEAAVQAPEETPAPRRPRGRTALIVACAALLGVVAGVATGYTIQADRKPTPLPYLSGPDLSYPEKRLSEDEHEPVSAEHDRRVRTDGDLRKLLVAKPKGARESSLYPSEPTMLSVGGYAREFLDPGFMFEYLLLEDVRRVAEIGWDSGAERTTAVTLVQFQETGLFRGAQRHARGQREYVELQGSAGSGHPLEGSGNARYYITDSPVGEPGYLPLYEARAIASRGDIMMDIEIYDVRPISEQDIRELAEKQWERL